MRKKQLIGYAFIFILALGVLPAIVFGIDSYSTGTSSPTIDPFTDDDWYESSDADSESPPSHNPATSTNRTDTQFTSSSASKYRFEIPSTIREGGPLYTKIWVMYDDSPSETTLISFLDGDNNTLFSEVPTNTSKGSFWYELDFSDWSGYAIRIQIDLAAQDTIQTASANTYDDDYYDGTWHDDPRDGLLIIYYVADYGYQESYREMGTSEWIQDSTFGIGGADYNYTTDGDIGSMYVNCDDGNTEGIQYHVGIYDDTNTYQFLEIDIIDIDPNARLQLWVYVAGYTFLKTITSSGTYRFNVEEAVSGATLTRIVLKLMDETNGYAGGWIYVEIDYIRLYRFYEWTDAESSGDQDNYAYESSGDLVVVLDASQYLNLTDDISDFSTDNYPYCRVDTSAGTVGVTLIDSGDAELETKTFTATTNTQQFSFGLSVDEIRLQITGSCTIDFITFSVMNVTISGITVNLEDTYASPDQTITISSVTGSWGDGNSISSSNLWVDLKENTTYVQTNETSPSRTVQLYNSSYEVGIGHTNDTRYRYFVAGTNYTFWMIGTQVTGNFYYDVQRIADVNYIVTMHQTSHFSWLNGSIITTEPEVYSYLNSTENGYDTLLSTGWFDNKIYPVSVTNTQGQYETTFKFNLTTGDFWEEFYSCVITPMDEVESHLVFSFYSNLDSLGLPDKLLKIYVDETRVHHMEHWIAGNTINLTITDYHNHEVEWEATGMSYPWYEFTAADIVFIDLGLDFYPLQFYNPGDYPLIVEITSNSESMNYTAHPYQSTPEHRTAAGAYTVKTWWYEYNEGEEAYTKIDEWEVTARPVTVTSESYNFQLKGVYKDEPVPKGEPTPDYVKPPEFWFGIGAVGCIIFLVGVAVVLSRREGGLVATPPPEEAEEPRKRLVNPEILKKIKLIDPKLYKEITEIEREIDRTEKTRKGGRR